jgi:hypothetical protein
MRNDNVYALPPDLPVPQNDGACDHLPGMAIPPVVLPSTLYREVSLLEESAVRTVVYCYPKSGTPDRDPPPGWNDIPGARGCTPQSCAFRDRYMTIRQVGANNFQTLRAKRLPFSALSRALNAARFLKRARLSFVGIPGRSR